MRRWRPAANHDIDSLEVAVGGHQRFWVDLSACSVYVEVSRGVRQSMVRKQDILISKKYARKNHAIKNAVGGTSRGRDEVGGTGGERGRVTRVGGECDRLSLIFDPRHSRHP